MPIVLDLWGRVVLPKRFKVDEWGRVVLRGQLAQGINRGTLEFPKLTF